MYNDVVDLRDFYASPAGRAARRVVQRQIRAMWPDLSGMNVAGIGYVLPYLAPFAEEAQRAVALMPARQGVIRWPASGRNAAALVPEEQLPLPDVSMDRVVLVHALECSENLRGLLREVWRILADGGRVLLLVPNRRGIWARLDHTPFGHGHPYTPGQLARLLRENLFVPSPPAIGLYMPPSRSRMILRSAPALEEVGRRWFRAFGGLLFVEAEKQIYAGTLAGAGRELRRRRYARIVGGTEHGSAPRGGLAEAPRAASGAAKRGGGPAV